MDTLEGLFETLSNLTQNQEPFVFDATNIDGIYKYLQTVRKGLGVRHFELRSCKFGIFAKIDWSEKWLWGVIWFHVVTFLSIVFSKRCSSFQIVLFFLLRKK